MDKIIQARGFEELPMKLLISQEDFIDVASNHPNTSIFRSKGTQQYLFIVDNGAAIYTNDYPNAQNFSEFKTYITGKNEAGFESQYLYEKACELGIKTSEEYNRFIKSGIIEYAKREKVREVRDAYGDEESYRSRLNDRYEKYAYHHLYVDYKKKNFEKVEDYLEAHRLNIDAYEEYRDFMTVWNDYVETLEHGPIPLILSGGPSPIDYDLYVRMKSGGEEPYWEYRNAIRSEFKDLSSYREHLKKRSREEVDPSRSRSSDNDDWDSDGGAGDGGRSSNDQRSDALNPNSQEFSDSNDNRSNQMNPNNSEYHGSRGHR